MYINSNNIPPIMIINSIYEHQNLLSLWLVSVLVGLGTYQHPGNVIQQSNVKAVMYSHILEYINCTTLIFCALTKVSFTLTFVLRPVGFSSCSSAREEVLE
jgi:hypothetical protein